MRLPSHTSFVRPSTRSEPLLIPHTIKVTTWGDRKSGDKVNIEVDQMARYAARLIEAEQGGA